MTIPEGRKPITDKDLADLTRRLAETAIERNCRCEELEAEVAALKTKLEKADGKIHTAVWALHPYGLVAKHHAADAPEWGPFDSVTAQLSIMYLRDALSALACLSDEEEE